MKRTLFSKMFTYNVAVVLLSMIMTSVLLYAQLGSYFKNTVYNNLESKAVQVAQMSRYLMEMSDKMGTRPILKEFMGNIGYEKGQGFIVVDARGEVLVHLGFSKEQLDENNISEEHVAAALNGEIVKSESNLGGTFSTKLLHVIVPLTTKQGIEGAVIMCCTEQYTQTMQIGVMKLVILIMIAVVMVTLVVSAFASNKLSRPINEMTAIVRKIASGDFSQRLKVDADGELGQLATSFNHMSVALQEMDEVQSAFISDVSHELRTPMTIISGFVDGILDGTIPEEQHKKYLEIVLSETKRLSRLVNDLLEMSRLNSGKIEYKMVPFNIDESIKKTIITFEQALNDKNIDMDVEFEDEDRFVMGNSDSIYRVITNLFDNAVKFTPEGGKITVKVDRVGQKTKVSVENSGKGLSEKELAHIWDRFYQTDKSRSNSGKKGVGLGLYIVKNIMKAHDNEIYAESEEGSWTRFTFELDSVKNR